MRQAEAELTRARQPDGFEARALEEQAAGAQAQAEASRVEVEVLRAQGAGAGSTEAAAHRAGAAQAAVRQAEASLALRSRPFTAEELRGARAQVDQARATLSAAQAQQREATVRAPRDGGGVPAPGLGRGPGGAW